MFHYSSIMVAIGPESFAAQWLSELHVAVSCLLSAVSSSQKVRKPTEQNNAKYVHGRIRIQEARNPICETIKKLSSFQENGYPIGILNLGIWVPHSGSWNNLFRRVYCRLVHLF